MIRGTTATIPRTPVSQGAGVFALPELQAIFTVIGARAGYVAPRTVSPLGEPEARVAKAQTNTLEKAPTGRLEGAGHKARA